MSFADFPEQQHVAQLLQRSLKRERLAHAYLFNGEQLAELEAMARTLAKTLNCQKESGGEPARRLDSCDDCLSCRKIDGAIHPDVHWVRPESRTRVITIDQVRDLMDEVHLKATEAQFKVAIFVGADRLNVQAGNAFLKTLEEPPSRSVLILLSTEPQRILETIQSRCLRLNFAGRSGPRFDAAQTAWLTAFSKAAAAERHGFLDRYNLVGMLLSRLSHLKAEIEKKFAERSPLERYDDIEPRLREKWEEELAAAVEAEYRRLRTELLTGLQWWLRDVWLKTRSVSEELVDLPQLGPTTEIVAGRITPEAAMENLQVMEHTQRRLNSNVQEALALGVGLLKLHL
jgi:DNA polymerase-3 subunit delta'